MKPTVEEMLSVAKHCGLNTIEEAYLNYTNHYTVFFLIDKFQEQLKQLCADLKELGFTEYVDGKLLLKQISVDEALRML